MDWGWRSRNDVLFSAVCLSLSLISSRSQLSNMLAFVTLDFPSRAVPFRAVPCRAGPRSLRAGCVDTLPRLLLCDVPQARWAHTLDVTV